MPPAGRLSGRVLWSERRPMLLFARRKIIESHSDHWASVPVLCKMWFSTRLLRVLAAALDARLVTRLEWSMAMASSVWSQLIERKKFAEILYHSREFWRFSFKLSCQFWLFSCETIWLLLLNKWSVLKRPTQISKISRYYIIYTQYVFVLI